MSMKPPLKKIRAELKQGTEVIGASITVGNQKSNQVEDFIVLKLSL